MTQKEQYMSRCCELAFRGYGLVNPNPMVGCVIVKNGRIIAEGFHKKLGEAHAEINALKKAGRQAVGATLYVNLEPCVHFGKTPPCADAIAKAGVEKVVAAARDPNELVAGKGFRKLRRAGLRVESGVLRDVAEKLNEKFFAFKKTGFPFVGIKVGQTLDGRIADSSGRSKWITSSIARKEAHRIRAGYDAILVGANTVAMDDPKLTVRFVKGRNPVRVIVDGNLSLLSNKKVFNTRKAETILFTSQSSFQKRAGEAEKIQSQGVRVIPMSDGPELSVKSMLKQLSVFGISSVLVEGGSTTIAAFMDAKVVKKVHCFVATKLLGGGIDGFFLKSPLGLHKSIQLVDTSMRSLGPDYLFEGYPRFA